MAKQGLVFVIASINISKSKEGEVLKSYWGEAVDGSKKRIGFRIGENQVHSLMDAAATTNYKDLIGKKISGNILGYAKDKEGKDLPGLFVLDRYIDDKGEEQPLNRETLLIGGLVQVVPNFDEWIHTKLDFDVLPRRCDTPQVKPEAKPKEVVEVDAEAAA